MRKQSGIVKPLILTSILLLILIGIGYYWLRNGDNENRIDDQLMFEAFRGEFVSSITESGTVESSNRVDIKCEVKSRGSAGTAILYIIPEGTRVRKSEKTVLVQFDDSDHKDRLIEQKIEFARNQAALIQAQSDLAAAEKMLSEYDKGTFKQEKSAIELEIAVATENLERSQEYLNFSQKLNAKNFIPQSELLADKFTVEKAEKELELAKGKLEVLVELTQKSTREQLQAEVSKQKANLDAAKYTVELSQNRVDEFEEQVEKCRIVAPADGQVVYANENDRDNSIVIEEGAIIRDGQEVIFLPDPDKMQVRTKVNDSKINLVSEGNEVEIRLDSAPDVLIRGKVKKKADFPLPQRWYQAPIEYEVFVEVTEINDLVKSGLRAKSKIIVDRQQDVLQIPASSIVRKQDTHYAIVAKNNRYVAQPVQVGASNDKFVIILSGLEEGEKVLINPEKQKDKLEYPDS